MSKVVAARMDALVQCTAVAVAIFVIGSGTASADELPCLRPGKLIPISGKIFNNALGPADTLGTLVANLDGTKLKCGLHGKAYFNADSTFGGFTHTLVCDDSVPAENRVDTIHTQAVSLTRFDGAPNFASCGIPGVDLQYGSFREISEPQSGRGILSPTGGGRLAIEGTINCAGAVDMKYTGHVCVVR